MYLVRVYVSLKSTVNDPQGLTILNALHSLGFSSVSDIRAGRYFVMRLDESDEESARRQVEESCKKLLANPIIEEYSFDLERVI
jgi:phosphoribosylformylglycinamidine synthase PurS subunit